MPEERTDDLDPLRADVPEIADDDLGARPSVAGLDALLETIESLDLEPITWLERGEIVATIEAQPRPLQTRDHAVAEELVDVVLLRGTPDWMDRQVNVRARGDVVEIELEVEESVGRLWSTVDVMGEPIGTPMVGDSADPRLRVARLPLALVAGHVVLVLLQPPT